MQKGSVLLTLSARQQKRADSTKNCILVMVLGRSFKLLSSLQAQHEIALDWSYFRFTYDCFETTVIDGSNWKEEIKMKSLRLPWSGQTRSSRGAILFIKTTKIIFVFWIKKNGSGHNLETHAFSVLLQQSKALKTFKLHWNYYPCSFVMQ